MRCQPNSGQQPKSLKQELKKKKKPDLFRNNKSSLTFAKSFNYLKKKKGKEKQNIRERASWTQKRAAECVRGVMLLFMASFALVI